MAIGTGAAILGSALIGGATSLMGGDKAAEGSEDAARLQAERYQEGKNFLTPYLKGSQSALNLYGNALGANGGQAQQGFYNNFQHDPGFQTALNSSLDETMKRYSIMGRTGGGLANSLLKTGQNALLGAYDKRVSQLGDLAGFGRGTASTIAGIGQQSAATQGGHMAQGGLHQGNSMISAGNALINGLNSYANAGQGAQGMAAGQNPAARPWDTFTVNNRAMF